MSFTPFSRVALIGIGLIGSSLAHVIRRNGLASEIVVSTRSEHTLRRAEELGLGDRYCLDAGEAVTDADLMAPHLPGTVHFIPGHPIAGTEESGPDAGFAELFRDRWCILTPPDDADADAVARLTAFWEACGSTVETMDADHHDLVLAIVSHLPHIIAYNIVGTADDLEAVTKSEVIKYSASGFRDFTRLAASDPTMWRDVCLHNKDAILEMLARFSEDLAALQRAVRWGDGDALFDLFTRTRSIRRSIVEAGQDTDIPNFGRDAVTKSAPGND
eukprot:jgi/Tetstr1/431523/TSEL_002175.t1